MLKRRRLNTVLVSPPTVTTFAAIPLLPTPIQAIVLECAIDSTNYHIVRQPPWIADREGDLCWLVKTASRTSHIRAWLVHKIEWLCRAGWLELLKTLDQIGAVTKADIDKDHHVALWMACKEGRLDIVKWLHTRFKLTAEDAIFHPRRFFASDVLDIACKCGHMPVLHYLLHEFGALSSVKRDKARRCNLVRMAAAQYQDLTITQYLCENLEISTEEIQNGVFQNVLLQHHYHQNWRDSAAISIARFLMSTYHLTTEDARSNRNMLYWILESACSRDNLEFVRFLVEEVGLKKNDFENLLPESLANIYVCPMEVASRHGPRVFAYLSALSC